MEKIKAVDMVRRIRDEQYDLTKDKLNEELKVYFHHEAKLANAEAVKLLKKRRTEQKHAA